VRYGFEGNLKDRFSDKIQNTITKFRSACHVSNVIKKRGKLQACPALISINNQYLYFAQKGIKVKQSAKI
jgi:hypothetical protein